MLTGVLLCLAVHTACSAAEDTDASPTVQPAETGTEAYREATATTGSDWRREGDDQGRRRDDPAEHVYDDDEYLRRNVVNAAR